MPRMSRTTGAVLVLGGLAVAAYVSLWPAKQQSTVAEEHVREDVDPEDPAAE
jgi:hypothetical protein